MFGLREKGRGEERRGREGGREEGREGGRGGGGGGRLIHVHKVMVLL